MKATLKRNQISGIPEGTYWFSGDHATRLIGKWGLSDDTYKLPKDFLQKLIDKKTK